MCLRRTLWRVPLSVSASVSLAHTSEPACESGGSDRRAARTPAVRSGRRRDRAGHDEQSVFWPPVYEATLGNGRR